MEKPVELGSSHWLKIQISVLREHFTRTKDMGIVSLSNKFIKAVFVGCSKNLDDGWINWSYHKADDRHGKGTDYMT